jgi:hypothetical protein
MALQVGMTGAGHTSQSPILGRHATRYVESPPESHPKHCLMAGDWPQWAEERLLGKRRPANMLEKQYQ